MTPSVAAPGVTHPSDATEWNWVLSERLRLCHGSILHIGVARILSAGVHFFFAKKVDDLFLVDAV